MKEYLAHVSFHIYSSTPKINKIKRSLSYDPYNGDIYNLTIGKVDENEYKIEYDVKEHSEKTCYSDAQFMIEERTDDTIYLEFMESTFKYTLYPKKASPKKTKRCPKGTRKNKITGDCESTEKKISAINPPFVVNSPSVKMKKERCPNGTRRNKKTGACEKK